MSGLTDCYLLHTLNAALRKKFCFWRYSTDSFSLLLMTRSYGTCRRSYRRPFVCPPRKTRNRRKDRACLLLLCLPLRSHHGLHILHFLRHWYTCVFSSYTLYMPWWRVPNWAGIRGGNRLLYFVCHACRSSYFGYLSSKFAGIMHDSEEKPQVPSVTVSG